ncbi:MAG: hypothetical protein ACOYNS_03015 [Bacteroidota bacterium]
MEFFRSVTISVAIILLSKMLPAQDVSITDFRIPKSQFHTLQFTLNGDVGQNRQGGGSYMTGSSSWNNYRLQAEDQLFYNSEERSYSFEAIVQGATVGNENHFHQTTILPKEQLQVYRNDGISIYYGGQYSHYITADKFYWFVSSGGNGNYEYRHNSNEQDGVVQSDGFNKIRNFSVSVIGGIGFGKMRDAQVVIVILRIIEDLNKDGYLVRELSGEEVMELASLYQTAIATNASHERPSKFIMKIIFDFLLEKNAVTDEKIIAYAAGRTSEVMHEQIYPRMFGWNIQAGVGASHSEQRQSAQSSYERFLRSDARDLMIIGNYGYPLSTLLHSYSSASIGIPIIGRQNRLNFSVGSGLTYELSNRISSDISVAYSRSASFTTGNLFTDEQFEFGNTFTASAGLNFFIEDFISLSVQTGYVDNLRRLEQVSNMSRTINDNYNVTFGVNYRVF